MLLISIAQTVEEIEDKIKNAPDSGYEIGVFIGSLIPFVVLVLIAYTIYRYNKNQSDRDI